MPRTETGKRLVWSSIDGDRWAEVTPGDIDAIEAEAAALGAAEERERWRPFAVHQLVDDQSMMCPAFLYRDEAICRCGLTKLGES